MFHFTIRDILWLTALSAVLVAWGIDHTKTRIDWQQVRATQQQLIKAETSRQWAEVQANAARHQQALIFKAANQRGVSLLDLEPETKINPELLGSDE
jgi:hypothetical protein